jgi:hypothetical protein
LIPDDDIFGADDPPPARPPTEAEQGMAAEFEARDRERREARDRVYQRLRLDAQACARTMSRSPRLYSPDAWEEVVAKALKDYRSGMSLLDQLGAYGLLDAPTAAMLLAIRAGLIEETNATSASELALIDMAVLSQANAMRIQGIIGNVALILEAEMFGQPTLRAKWKSQYGQPGLAIEEHVARLRDTLLPIAEKAQRIAREHIEAISRMRQQPSLSVERAEAVNVVLLPPGPAAGPV